MAHSRQAGTIGLLPAEIRDMIFDFALLVACTESRLFRGPPSGIKVLKIEGRVIESEDSNESWIVDFQSDYPIAHSMVTGMFVVFQGGFGGCRLLARQYLTRALPEIRFKFRNEREIRHLIKTLGHVFGSAGACTARMAIQLPFFNISHDSIDAGWKGSPFSPSTLAYQRRKDFELIAQLPPNAQLIIDCYGGYGTQRPCKDLAATWRLFEEYNLIYRPQLRFIDPVRRSTGLERPCHFLMMAAMSDRRLSIDEVVPGQVAALAQQGCDCMEELLEVIDFDPGNVVIIRA